MKINKVNTNVSTTLGDEFSVGIITLEAEGTNEEFNCFMESVGDYVESMCECCCEDECVENTHMPKPIFGGAFYNECGDFLYIKKVVYDKANRTVVVVWNDEVVTKSTCHVDDKWNSEAGLLVATMKRVAGNEFTKLLLSDWSVSTSSGNKTVVKTLKDVRKLHRQLDKVGK